MTDVIVFSALIYRCYNIFQATKRTKYTAKPSKAGAIQVAVAAAAFLLFLILRTALTSGLVQDIEEVVKLGESTRKTYKCRQDTWEFIILGVEVLMVIVGVALAIQIRNIQTAFRDSFSMGVCVYVWAFIKILTEGFLIFIPYDYNVFFGLKAFGELITCWHTAHLFLFPKYQLIRDGKGNEEPQFRTGQSHGYSSATGGLTQSRGEEEVEKAKNVVVLEGTN